MEKIEPLIKHLESAAVLKEEREKIAKFMKSIGLKNQETYTFSMDVDCHASVFINGTIAEIRFFVPNN